MMYLVLQLFVFVFQVCGQAIRRTAPRRSVITKVHPPSPTPGISILRVFVARVFDLIATAARLVWSDSRELTLTRFLPIKIDHILQN